MNEVQLFQTSYKRPTKKFDTSAEIIYNKINQSDMITHNTQTKTNAKTQTKLHSPIIKEQERLLVWRQAKGMWADRRPDPLLELDQMRQEWD